jgi:hypothetical protein
VTPRLVLEPELGGWVAVGVLGLPVGGLADRVDLDDPASRRRAARWLAATGAVPYRQVLDELDQAALDRRYGRRRVAHD